MAEYKYVSFEEKLGAKTATCRESILPLLIQASSEVGLPMFIQHQEAELARAIECDFWSIRVLMLNLAVKGFGALWKNISNSEPYCPFEFAGASAKLMEAITMMDVPLAAHEMELKLTKVQMKELKQQSGIRLRTATANALQHTAQDIALRAIKNDSAKKLRMNELAAIVQQEMSELSKQGKIPSIYAKNSSRAHKYNDRCIRDWINKLGARKPDYISKRGAARKN